MTVMGMMQPAASKRIAASVEPVVPYLDFIVSPPSSIGPSPHRARTGKSIGAFEPASPPERGAEPCRFTGM